MPFSLPPWVWASSLASGLFTSAWFLEILGWHALFAKPWLIWLVMLAGVFASVGFAAFCAVRKNKSQSRLLIVLPIVLLSMAMYGLYDFWDNRPGIRKIETGSVQVEAPADDAIPVDFWDYRVWFRPSTLSNLIRIRYPSRKLGRLDCVSLFSADSKWFNPDLGFCIQKQERVHPYEEAESLARSPSLHGMLHAGSDIRWYGPVSELPQQVIDRTRHRVLHVLKLIHHDGAEVTAVGDWSRKPVRLFYDETGKPYWTSTMVAFKSPDGEYREAICSHQTPLCPYIAEIESLRFQAQSGSLPDLTGADVPSSVRRQVVVLRALGRLTRNFNDQSAWQALEAQAMTPDEANKVRDESI